MNIDPANLPAELWAIDRTRVRAGRGPIRVVPARPSLTSSAGVPCGVETAGGRYYSADCLYATRDEAKAVGAAIVREEAYHEQLKYHALIAKLVTAMKAKA